MITSKDAKPAKQEQIHRKFADLKAEIEKGLDDLRNSRVVDGPKAMAKLRKRLLLMSGREKY